MGECRCPQSPEDGVLASGTEVAGNSCEYPDQNTGNDLGSSGRAEPALTSELFIQFQDWLSPYIFFSDQSHTCMLQKVHVRE